MHSGRPNALTAVFRMLLVRLLLGMGKKKFSKGWSESQNRLYIKAHPTPNL